MTNQAAPGATVEAKRPWLLRYAIYSSIFAGWMVLIFFVTGGRSDPMWLAHWQRWDANWYEQIWSAGYRSDPKTLAFPPAFPYLMGIVAKIFSKSFLGTAVVLNLFAFFAAAAVISDWLSRKFGVSPYLLFAFTVSAPAAYFAFTSYSDVVFMLLLWVLLYIALDPKEPDSAKIVIAQALLLFLLPWVRLTGYALASWLLARRRAAFAVIAALALWLGFNRIVAGNPFYFLRAQETFAMQSGGFFQGLASSLAALLSYYLPNGYLVSWLQFGFLPLFYLAALTAVAIWLAKHGEGLLAITTLAILFLSHNQGAWRSVVRYDLPILPFLCLPLLGAAGSSPKSRWLKAAFYLLLASQIALQLIFARSFHSGGWAF